VIYLASPYTDIDPTVRQQRFEAACRAAAELMRAGKTIFAPIAYSHVLCSYELPINWNFWQRHDREYLEVCEGVVVLMLPGWEESVGVQAEIAIARELGKPVTYLSVSDRAEKKSA
jgi:hypothetical protein